MQSTNAYCYAIDVPLAIMDPSDGAPRLPARKEGRKKRKAFIDNSGAPLVSVGSSGRPSGSGSGPSRDTQRLGTEAAKATVAARAREHEDGEGNHQASMEDDQPSESKHAEKVRKQQAAWKEQLLGLRSLYLDLPWVQH